MLDDILSGEEVAPYTGAWIEIIDRLEQFENWDTVAPYTGAWIEIQIKILSYDSTLSRTLHGCVD